MNITALNLAEAIKHRLAYAKQIIGNVDTSKDGIISTEEYSSADKNGNGYIEGKELGINPAVERYFYMRGICGTATEEEVTLNLSFQDLKHPVDIFDLLKQLGDNTTAIERRTLFLPGADLTGSLTSTHPNVWHPGDINITAEAFPAIKADYSPAARISSEMTMVGDPTNSVNNAIVPNKWIDLFRIK
jgi:hypothetical protein